jgi:hypothetical protein
MVLLMFIVSFLRSPRMWDFELQLKVGVARSGSPKDPFFVATLVLRCRSGRRRAPAQSTKEIGHVSLVVNVLGRAVRLPELRA